MFYCLDENNNKVETFDIQGVLNAIEKAIADGSLAGLVADAAFVSKIKCCVTNGTTKMAFVTQAKYNELKAANLIAENTIYFITDDTTPDDIDKAFEELNTKLTNLETKVKAIEGVKRLLYSSDKFTSSSIEHWFDYDLFEKNLLIEFKKDCRLYSFNINFGEKPTPSISSSIRTNAYVLDCYEESVGSDYQLRVVTIRFTAEVFSAPLEVVGKTYFKASLSASGNKSTNFETVTDFRIYEVIE